jgi:hypothetical protein
MSQIENIMQQTSQIAKCFQQTSQTAILTISPISNFEPHPMGKMSNPDDRSCMQNLGS